MATAPRLLGESSRTLIRLSSRSFNASSRTRSLATEATAATTATASASTSSRSSSGEKIGAYFLLSRLPVVLPSPTPFESAFYAYNAKVQRTLSQPFPRDLYFKKGSAAETQFNLEETEREAEMGKWGTERHGAASIVSVQGGEEGVRARTTKADETRDLRSLERSLDRTLFLVVRGVTTGDRWTLPRTTVDKRGAVPLHRASTDALHALLGDNMDIWMVTNLPVGLIGKEAKATDEGRGYVMRAHITAGSPTPTSKGLEYAWLTQEELEKEVGPTLYDDVKDLLSA